MALSRISGWDVIGAVLGHPLLEREPEIVDGRPDGIDGFRFEVPLIVFLERILNGLAHRLSLRPEGLIPQGQGPLTVHRHRIQADRHALGCDLKWDVGDDLGSKRGLDVLERAIGHRRVEQAIEQHVEGVAVGDVPRLGVVPQAILDLLRLT